MVDVVTVVQSALQLIKLIRDAHGAVVVHRQESARLMERTARFQGLLEILEAMPEMGDCIRGFAEAMVSTMEEVLAFLRGLGTVSTFRKMLQNCDTTETFSTLSTALDRYASDLNLALTLQGQADRAVAVVEAQNDRRDREDDLKELLEQLLATSKKLHREQGAPHGGLLEEFQAMKDELQRLHARLEPQQVEGVLYENVAAVLAKDEAVKPAHEIIQDHQQVLLQNYEQKGRTDIRNLVCVGQGGFSRVFKADSTSGHIAVKQLGHVYQTVSADDQRKLLNELLVQIKAVCPNVVHMYGFASLTFPGFGSASLCLLMEYAELGSLQGLLEACTGEDGAIEAPAGAEDVSARLTVPAVLTMLLDVARGIEHIHSQCVIHRDIKPQNVLITGGFRLKISDFGLSKQKIDGITLDSEPAGTLKFMAPEMLAAVRRRGPARYSYTVDCYNFGVLVHDVCQTAYAPEVPGLNEPLPAPFSRGLEHLRAKCLAEHPRERYGRGSASGASLSEQLSKMLRRAGGSPRDATEWARTENLNMLIHVCKNLQRSQEVQSGAGEGSIDPVAASVGASESVPAHQGSSPASPRSKSRPRSRRRPTTDIVQDLAESLQTIGIDERYADGVAATIKQQGFHTLAALHEPWAELGEAAFFEQVPMPLSAKLKLKAFLAGGASWSLAQGGAGDGDEASGALSGPEELVTAPGAPPPPDGKLPAALRQQSLASLSQGPAKETMEAIRDATGDVTALTQALSVPVCQIPVNVSHSEFAGCVAASRHAAQPFVAAGILEAAKWAVECYPGDADLVCAALRLFGAEVYAHSSQSSDKGHSVMVAAVLGAMRRHSHHTGVQIHAMAAMRFLGYVSLVTRDAFARAGAAQDLVKSMRARPAHAVLQHQACAAMHGLARGSSTLKDELVERGAAELLVMAVETHAMHIKLQRQACGAIASLAKHSERRSDALSAAGVVRALVTSMRAHPNHAELQEHICATIANLAFRSEERRAALMAEGALDLLVTAMQAHAGHAGLQQHTCSALANLAMESEERKDAIIAADGDGLIAAAMRTHAGHAELQQHACAAIANLATGSEERRAELAAAGAMELVAGAMRSHVAHEELQQHACAAMANLATGNEARKGMLAAWGGLDLAVAALRNHGNHAEVSYKACGAMWNVAAGGDDRWTTLAAAGAADLVARAMATHEGHERLQLLGGRLGGALAERRL